MPIFRRAIKYDFKIVISYYLRLFKLTKNETEICRMIMNFNIVMLCGNIFEVWWFYKTPMACMYLASIFNKAKWIRCLKLKAFLKIVLINFYNQKFSILCVLLLLFCYCMIISLESVLLLFPNETLRNIELMLARFLNNARYREGGRTDRQSKRVIATESGSTCKQSRQTKRARIISSDSDSD